MGVGGTPAAFERTPTRIRDFSWGLLSAFSFMLEKQIGKTFMPYSKFTLSKAVDDFQLTIVEGDRSGSFSSS